MESIDLTWGVLNQTMSEERKYSRYMILFLFNLGQIVSVSP